MQKDDQRLTKNRQAAFTVGASGNLMDKIPEGKQHKQTFKGLIQEACGFIHVCIYRNR